MLFTIAGGILIAVVILCNLRFFMWLTLIGGAGFGLLILIAMNGGFQ